MFLLCFNGIGQRVGGGIISRERCSRFVLGGGCGFWRLCVRGLGILLDYTKKQRLFCALHKKIGLTLTAGSPEVLLRGANSVYLRGMLPSGRPRGSPRDRGEGLAGGIVEFSCYCLPYITPPTKDIISYFGLKVKKKIKYLLYVRFLLTFGPNYGIIRL